MVPDSGGIVVMSAVLGGIYMNHALACARVLSAVMLFQLMFPVQSLAHADVTSAKPIADKWAVVIGISEFLDPKINLRFARKDAEEFSKFLIEKQNFAPDHVKLLTDSKATTRNILSVLGSKWLPILCQPDDLVVFYFSGHGSPSFSDIGGINYLVTYDTDVGDLYPTGIAMKDLSRIMKERVHCDRILYILDACYSANADPLSKGLVRRSNIEVEELVQGSGHLVISSSQPDQSSWESKRYQGGVFTKHLIDGLRQHEDSTAVTQAFAYLLPAVRSEVLQDHGLLQEPCMKGNWQGNELIIGVRPTRMRQGLTDIELPDKSVAVASTERYRWQMIRGTRHSSALYHSSWLDLSAATDFSSGDKLRISIDGSANTVVVRFLSEGENPDHAVGIIGTFPISDSRVLEVTLTDKYDKVNQISVHGGPQAWNARLGADNGDPIIQSVSRSVPAAAN